MTAVSAGIYNERSVVRILVVEDETKVAALKEGLGTEGYEVSVAHTGEDGLKMKQLAAVINVRMGLNAQSALPPRQVEASTVLFVCEHEAAKSVIAAAHFNRLAVQKGVTDRDIQQAKKRRIAGRQSALGQAGDETQAAGVA